MQFEQLKIYGTENANYYKIHLSVSKQILHQTSAALQDSPVRYLCFHSNYVRILALVYHKETVGDYDWQYDGSLGISELLQEKVYNEELQGLFADDWRYKEMLQDVIELERHEGNVTWEESASEDIVVFLKQFPEQRKEIEKCIQCLKEMADNIDETHKKCTIANIAANSTSITSGILTILGLTLAPLTAGGSLVLTATGIGLGAAAAATNISVSIYENVSNSKERRKANDLLLECQSNLNTLTNPDEVDLRPEFSPESDIRGDHLKHILSTASKIPDVVYRSATGIKTNVRAFKLLKANPGLNALAKRLAATGRMARNTARGTKQMQKAFAGTTLAMSKGARVLGATAAGVFVVLDAYSLVKDSIHLTEGAKAEAAADIREKASIIERDLQNLSELYEELKDMVFE